MAVTPLAVAAMRMGWYNVRVKPVYGLYTEFWSRDRSQLVSLDFAEHHQSE